MIIGFLNENNNTKYPAKRDATDEDNRCNVNPK